MPRRRADRIDDSQRAIVKALRALQGITVELGHDDILVGYRGSTYWYEVKSGRAVSKKTGKILDSAKKPDQVRLENEFTGHYKIVFHVEQILKDIDYPIGGDHR